MEHEVYMKTLFFKTTKIIFTILCSTNLMLQIFARSNQIEKSIQIVTNPSRNQPTLTYLYGHKYIGYTNPHRQAPT